jgi:hypothetical protein
MPIGTPRPYTKIAPREWFGQQDGSHWSPAADGRSGMTCVQQTGGEAWALCPGSGGGRFGGIGRLLCVEAESNINIGSSPAPRLARWNNFLGTSTTQDLNDAALLLNAASAAVWLERSVFERNHTPAAGPTIQANAAGMGPPVWTNGARALQPASGDQTEDWNALILRWPAPNASSSVTIWRATFFVAEGL